MTRLYEDLAEWRLISSPQEEYAEEAALYVDMIRSAASIPVRDALEPGSGGANASHMKRH